VIPALVQEILVAIIVGGAVVALVSRFVVHRRVRRCPSCATAGAARRAAGGKSIRAKGLEILS
jgi:hypothetical protein